MKTERFVCTVAGCHRSYFSQENLNKHHNSVHGEAQIYQCEICKHYLSSKQNLKEHMLKHTNEKPFVCEVFGCRKQFRQGSQLSLHRKMHREINSRVQKIKEEIKIRNDNP